FFQLFDEFFDVRGHLVEVFGEFADLQRAASHGPLMKFAAADRARGCRKATDGSADAYGKEIPDHDGGQHHDAGEHERLTVQLIDAGVALRLIETPLWDD